MELLADHYLNCGNDVNAIRIAAKLKDYIEENSDKEPTPR